ncbi:GspH/FimT family pseudopilin [Desulfobacula toluolica]|uniref:Type II secretion system protein H n=1 Tax=Desulfobacula toluolica (strain DSM 7467 / Tol2) TaxID=651182 RepID=K0NNH2_DESTT|nr:GspH/FimT family pseudopilin [Desulfobacula toluolica]CCK80317.1 prepilin-type cleavage/methylation domain protein [Desulfobacula toluolica Tol2]
MFETPKDIKGFTLIELMIVIAIISLLVVVTPNFGRILADQRLKGCARDIYSKMQKAKSEAIKRNTTVGISFTPAAFVPDGRAGTYTVFIDNGGVGGGADDLIHDTGNPNPSDDEATIAFVTMPKNVSLVNANFSGTSVAGFNSRGLPARSRIGNIQVRNSTRWYKITLSIAGNLQMQISGDGTDGSWQ